MASTQATIDLVVRGSNAVNKLIQDVGQLESAVKRINSRTLEVATEAISDTRAKINKRLKGIGTAKDPRPDVAQRVDKLTRQQTASTKALAAAQVRLAKSSAEAARAEEQLIERSQRRTRSDSQAQKNIENRLNRSRGLASAASGEINQLSGQLRSIARQFAAIQRTSAQAIIPETKNLIDINQVAATQRAIKVLAEEFNRLGDSAKSGIEENNLSRNLLPAQMSQFSKLSDQLAEARTRAQALREELAAIGRNERLVRAPSAGSVILDDKLSAVEMMQALKNQPKETEIAGQNQGIQERNRARQRQRAEIRASLGQESTLIGQLEDQAVTAGRKVVELQDKLADLVEFRYKTEPQTGRNISLNQIQAQAEALALVANNSAVASNAFRQYTVATEVASIKLARTQQETFAALAAGFSSSGGVQAAEGLPRDERTAGARGLVGQVLTEMPTFATGASEAALGGYINMLQSLKAIVPGLGIEYRALEEAIARANEEMRSAQLGIVGAPASRLGSLEAFVQQQKFEEREQKVQEKRQKNINDLLEKQADIESQIESSRLSGSEKTSLRQRAEGAVNALIEDRLEDSKEMTRLLERQLKASTDLLKAKPPQVFGIADKDFFSVTGKLADGGFAPGSPATEIEERKNFDRRLKEESDFFKKQEQTRDQVEKEQRKTLDRKLKEESDAFKKYYKDLEKYENDFNKNAEKLRFVYDKRESAKNAGEYLAYISEVEQAADQILKTQGKDAVSDFNSRLRARVDNKGAGNQLSSQTLQLEKLQKTLTEAEIDGVNVSKNKAAVEKLIADIKSGQIPVSKLSVDLVAKELKDARSRLGISQSQAKIDGKIADVLKGAVGGPSKKINDLAAQQKYATAINDTYRQTEDILTKISEASISTTRKLALAGNVEQARYELYENRLENAQGITKEVERQLKLETAMQKGAGGGRKTPAADPLKEESEARRIISNQLAALEDIQTRYSIEEKKGVQLAAEKVELGKLINAIKNDEVALTKNSTKAIGESIRILNAYGRYAKNRAIDQGTYAGGSKTGSTGSGATTAEQLEARRNRLLDLARGGLSQLIDLERKGVVVSDERLKVEQAISDIQSLRGKASKDELVTLAQKVIAAKDFAKGMAIDLKAGALPGVGLQAALQSLQEARQSRQQFLGAMSPAEGIDKIVREFNTGKPVAQNLTSTFAQDIQSGSGTMAKAATSAFTAVKNAIQKVWKIKSPSGVMIEIVKNIVSTFVTEILAAGPSVRSAIENTFNSKSIDRDYGDIGTRNPRTPSPAFGLDPNVALRLGGGRVTGGYPPTRGIFAPGPTPPIGGFGSGYPFFPPYQMTGTKQLPTPGMKGAQFPVDPMVDLRRNRPEDTSKVVTEWIKQFRVDRDNFRQDPELRSKDFWATEFDVVSRALKSGAQLSLARLARRLQQSKVLTPDQEFKQVANEARSLLPAGGSSELSGFAEGGSTFGKTFVSGQGEDRYRLGYSEGMLGIPDDLQDIPLEGGNKIKNAVESFYDKIVKSLGGLGGPGGPGGPRPPAGGGAGGGFYNDPGDLARRATEAAQQGPEALLGLKELAAPAKVSTKELEALSAILKEFRSVLDPTVEGFDQLNKRLRKTTANIDRQIERRAPDADFLTREFGPRTGSAISEGLIGGAFPLLFGQGIGASAGGLAGGVAGGFAGGGLGFGLSLIGTALGTAFDTLAQAAQDTGKSLNYPIEGFENLKTAGLFASRQQEYYISKLIETGQTARAAAEIQARIVGVIGVQGANDLMDLGDSASVLSKKWAELNLQMQALVAGPVGDFLNLLAKVAGAKIESNAMAGLGERISRLTPEQRKAFQQEAKAFSGPDYVKGAEAILNRIAPQQLKKAKDDPAQQEAALQAQRQVADQIKSAYREGFQLQQRAIDLELKTADIRRRIENEIFNKQQELLQQQIDNDRKRAQVAIETVDLEYQKRIANEEGRAAEVLAAEAELFKTRAQGEAEIATAKKLLELDIAKRQRETQDYVYSLGREADSIRRETLGFEMEVADYRLKIEREIENERLVAAAAEKAGATTTTAERTKGGAAASVPDLNAGMTGANWPAGVPRPGTSAAGAMTRGGRPIWSGAPAGVIEYYTGDPAMRGTPAYDPRGHGGKVHHEHVAFKDARSKDTAIEALRGAGLAIGSQYRPGDPGFHGKNLAIDVPAYPNFGRMGFPDNEQGERMLGALVRTTITKALGGAVAAAPALTAAAPTATAAQLEQARSQVRRPLIAPVPVDAAVGARAALDAEDTRLKEGAIALDQKLAQLQEEKARQRLYEVARGPIEIKQRQEIVNLAKAELAVIGPMSQNKQEAVLFETQASEILKNRQATDNEILKITKLQGEERKKLEQALADGVANTRKQIELDREALKLAQERRFIEEKAGLTQQLAVTGVAEEAGFFGAGANAFTTELSTSGNAAQATEIAQQTRALEVKQAVAGIRGELNSLTDSTNIAITAANGVGVAFAQSFQGLIDGSMTAKEALGSFFKSVADMFLEMAAQIIAKQITMIILQTILKALGAAAGASGGGGTGDSAKFGLNTPDMQKYAPLAANGAYFSDGMASFANGGAFTNSIVSSPTLFRFADGGVTRMGEMGEAGPEAIMPLSRGAGGRLGVDASGLREAMDRQQGGSSGSPVLNMSFQSTSINGVEYVSRDQLESAMAETRRNATRDGAKRGMTMTLDRIQNSSSTRRKVGI